MSPEATNSPLLTPRPEVGASETLWAIFAVAFMVSMPVLTLLMLIFNAYVLTVLWGWFVVPVFHLAALTLPLAIGLKMVGWVLTGSLHITASDAELDQQDDKKEEPEASKLSAHRRRQASSQLLRALLRFFATGLVPLSIGWFVHRFFM